MREMLDLETDVLTQAIRVSVEAVAKSFVLLGCLWQRMPQGERAGFHHQE